MMDSARDFDLLGESVPQVRDSTLALLGFFQLVIYSDSLLPLDIYIIYIYIYITADRLFRRLSAHQCSTGDQSQADQKLLKIVRSSVQYR